MRYVASHDVAKAFGRYQDEAMSNQPIAVTRYGRPTVVILSYAEYERLRGGEQRPPRREVFRAGEIPDELIQALEQTSPPPEAAAFDHELSLEDEPA
jgi:prevent-host-death family protein